jgi:hypothetical protein
VQPNSTTLLSKLYVFTGLASVPFHVFIIASFCKLHQRPDIEAPPTRVLMLSLASLLYVALDVLPSTFFFTDLTCACETEECIGDTSACRTSRYSIFVLMLIFYSLLSQIVKLAVQLDEKHTLGTIRLIKLYTTFGDYINWYMKNLNHICEGHHMKINYAFWDCLPKMMMAFLISFASHLPPLHLSVVVAGCLIASIVLDTNEGPETNNQYWVNNMRDSFTCNPRFSGLFLAGDFPH